MTPKNSRNMKMVDELNVIATMRYPNQMKMIAKEEKMRLMLEDYVDGETCWGSLVCDLGDKQPFADLGIGFCKEGRSL